MSKAKPPVPATPKEPGSLKTVHAAAVCALLAIVGAGYAWGIRPVQAAQAERVALLEAVGAAEGDVRRLGAVARGASAEVQRLRDAAELTPMRLDAANSINRRVAQLTEVAEGLRLKLDGVRPQPPEPMRYYQRVPLKVTGFGRFDQCVAFLDAVHAMNDVTVDVWSLAAEPEDREPVARLRCTLVWHTTLDGEGGR